MSEEEKKAKKAKEAEQATEFELDSKALESIAEKVSAGLAKTVEETVNKAVDEKVAAIEPTVKKAVNGGKKKGEEGGDPDDADAPDEKESKELRFVKSAIALINGDRATLRAYNEKAIESREKAGYANTDVNADGGYIVADPEFEAEVEKLSEDYGVAFQDADVRNISSNSIKTNKRGSNVTMYETAEGAQKTGTKLTIDQVTVELRKFAAIAVATDELVEDAAIDFWQEVADGFAEERARIADEMVFIDPDAETPGVLEKSGVIVESVGTSIQDITWDDLLNAEAAVPTKAFKNGKHYMHRTVWNVVRKSKDSEGRYQLVPQAGLQTPWGTPVVLVDVLPATTEDANNKGFAVFGDLKRIKLYVKRGLVLKQLTEATVHDAAGNAVNLAEKDMTALRAVTRMVALVKFPEAFCVIGTGTVS